MHHVAHKKHWSLISGHYVLCTAHFSPSPSSLVAPQTTRHRAQLRNDSEPDVKGDAGVSALFIDTDKPFRVDSIPVDNTDP